MREGRYGVTGHQFEIGRDGPTAVVVGVDGSDPSLRAAAYAVGVCRRQGSRLVVVYVREPGGGVAPGDTPPGESSTSGAAFQEPDLPSRRTNWLVYALIGVVVLAVLLLFVGYVVGLLA